jgi:hypothetical protein
MKINGKNVNIKPYRELTLGEYTDIIELMKDKPTFNIFDYMAYMLGYKFEQLMLQEVKGIELLAERLGKLKVITGDKEQVQESIEKQPLKRFFVYDGKLYDVSKVDMKSKVGYRVVIEQYMLTKPSYMDMYIFAFATVINEKLTKGFDYDSILKVKEDFKKYNAYDILGNGAFFLSNFLNGEKKGLQCLKIYGSTLTKIIVQWCKRVYTTLKSIHK